MSQKSQSGYFVLADISGYTSFLVNVEIEHAHDILTDLLEVIVDKFKSLLIISKLEGDAVFAYVEESRVPRGETILELIENAYVAFRQQRDTSKRGTTCNCNACQTMPSLELKFFVHFGDFIIQHVAGIQELVGSDVNLAHRLMKNSIVQNTGWKAYALFTRLAMQRMQLELKDVHKGSETYEHLGNIEVVAVDLLARYDAIIATQRLYLSEEEADVSRSRVFSRSSAELWQMVTSPEAYTSVWNNHTTWLAGNRPGGRSGVGAVNHCLHGDKLLGKYTIIDWKPFNYFTTRYVAGITAFEMFEFKPTSDRISASLTYRWKFDSGLPQWIGKLLGKIIASLAARALFNKLNAYINGQLGPRSPQP